MKVIEDTNPSTLVDFCSINRKNLKRNYILQILEFIEKINYALQILHDDYHVIHGDVKTANLLLDIREHNLIPLIDDWEFVSQIGGGILFSEEEKSNVAKYEFFDPTAKTGYFFPTVDIWGLAITLGQCLFSVSFNKMIEAYVMQNPRDPKIFDNYINSKIREICLFKLSKLSYWQNHEVCNLLKEIEPINFTENIFREIIEKNISEKDPSKDLMNLFEIIKEIEALFDLSKLIYQIMENCYEVFEKYLSTEMGRAKFFLEVRSIPENAALYEKYMSMQPFARKVAEVKNNLTSK